MLPDHTGLLESDEVLVALGDESAQYEVNAVNSIVAMRLPSYFLGDLRKLKTVSKAKLNERCRLKGLCSSKSDFFSGITAALVLSTKGKKSQADMMSGGDFDGDKAWCCWNEKILGYVKESPGQNTELYKQPKDPFKEQPMNWSDPDWSNLIINYTMQHRHDKRQLGALV